MDKMTGKKAKKKVAAKAELKEHEAKDAIKFSKLQKLKKKANKAY